MRRQSFPAFAEIADALQEVWPAGEVASVEEVESRLAGQWPATLVEATIHLFLERKEVIMATILVVEDDVDLCNLIRRELESEGHTVSQAFDGQTALTLVEMSPLHLVILDWMLPGLDGLSVCRKLRDDKRFESTPIYLLSAKGDIPTDDEQRQLRITGYLTKPFSPLQVYSLIKQYLNIS